MRITTPIDGPTPQRTPQPNPLPLRTTDRRTGATGPCVIRAAGLKDTTIAQYTTVFNTSERRGRSDEIFIVLQNCRISGSLPRSTNQRAHSSAQSTTHSTIPSTGHTTAPFVRPTDWQKRLDVVVFALQDNRQPRTSTPTTTTVRSTAERLFVDVVVSGDNICRNSTTGATDWRIDISL